MNDDVSIDTLAIEIDGTTKDSSASIKELISLLKELKTSLESTINASKNFKELKTNLSTATTKASNIRTSSGRKTSTSNSYGSINSQLMDEKLGLNIGSEDELKAVAELKSRIVDVNGSIEKYVTQNDKLVTVSKRTKDGVENVKVSVQDLNKETEKGSTAFSKFGSVLSKGAKSLLGIFGINASWNSLKNYTEEATAYTEALNLFMVTMGDNAEKATEWVKKFSEALYLDPADLMQYMGSFNSLVKGLGVGVENSYLMSKNLTQLTYDLASFKNLSFDTAFRKLQSAISGELEPLRNVGVALSQATLQTLAYSLGIERNVADMTEAEKAQLRYIQIMKSSSEWQTDMARTLMSPANAIRVIKQQFTLLARAIGNVLIPILMMAIPYVMVITQWLTKLANKLAGVLKNLFGIELNFDYDREVTGIGEIASGIGDIGDAAGKATKKLNTMLAPFDDLNVVQNQLDKNGGGLDDMLGGGDLGMALPEYDALAGLTDKFKANMGKAKENLEKLLPLLKTLGAILLAYKIGKPVLEFLKLFTGGGSALTSGIGAVAGKLGIGSGSLLGIIGSLAGSFVLAKGSVSAFKTVLEELGKGKSLSDALGKLSGFEKFSSIMTFFTPGNELGRITAGFGILKEAIKELQEPAVKSRDVVKDLKDEISETSRQKLDPLVKEFEELDKTLRGIELKDKLVTQEDIDSTKASLEEIKKTIVSQLDVEKDEQLKNIKLLEKTLGVDKTRELMEKTSTFYEEQKKTFQSKEDEILKILQAASDEKRALTDEEVTTIGKLRQEMLEKSVQQATQNGEEYATVMAKLKDNTIALSIEQASEYIKNAKKTRDETIKLANQQFETVLKEAYKMREAGTITQEEYDKIVKAAFKTRDETASAAQKQYDDINKATREKLGANADIVDEETGKITSKSDSFFGAIGKKVGSWLSDKLAMFKKSSSDITKESKSATDGLTKNMNDALKLMNSDAKTQLSDLSQKFCAFEPTVKTPHFTFSLETKNAGETFGTINIPKIGVSYYAEGGFPTSGDLFFANENGPEMVGRIGNRTAVANNDQITTSITNAVVEGIATSGLGGNSKGKTIIYLGNKAIYEGYGDYVDSENDRYGTNVIRV